MGRLVQAKEAFDDILYDVKFELQRAISVNGDFASPHEGYAVMLEELDELWDEVRKNKSDRDYDNMYQECVQVAAMAVKFADSLARWRKDAGGS